MPKRKKSKRISLAENFNRAASGLKLAASAVDQQQVRVKQDGKIAHEEPVPMADINGRPFSARERLAIQLMSDMFDAAWSDAIKKVNARMPEGHRIEMVLGCEVKMHVPGGDLYMQLSMKA